MDELIKLISEKLGVSKENARKAVVIMDCYMMEKLPPTIYNDVEMILGTKSITEEEKQELGLFTIP
jgi:hypothetical protein